MRQVAGLPSIAPPRVRESVAPSVTPVFPAVGSETVPEGMAGISLTGRMPRKISDSVSSYETRGIPRTSPRNATLFLL